MTTDPEWEQFKAKYDKSYKNAKEEKMRRKLYLESKKRNNIVFFYSDFTAKEYAEAGVGNGCAGYFSYPSHMSVHNLDRVELPFVANF